MAEAHETANPNDIAAGCLDESPRQQTRALQELYDFGVGQRDPASV